MQGSSRASFAQARESFLARSVADSATETGNELLSVAAVLGEASGLRAALSDTGESVRRREDLVDTVFGGKVGEAALTTVKDVVARRWSEVHDLSDAIEVLGAESLLIGAEAEGRIDKVEDELFRFARVVEASPQLRTMLADHATPTEVKVAVVQDLLASQVEPETVTLINHVVEHPSGRRVENALSRLVERAALRREELLADVRVAAPLREDQEERLARALGAIYHRKIVLQVTVDTSVLGGAVVKVGDEVVDGSVAARLADVQRMMNT